VPRLIKVLLVDDHRLVRAGLQSLLDATDDIRVVGAAADGREALELATGLEPDVVLMDLSMPGMGGVEATRRLLADRPGLQVVVLTSFSDQDQVLDAVDAGAVGYLLKDADPADLLQGVRAAAAGQSPLDPKVARTLLTRRTTQAPQDQLSDREREVLTLVAEGLANKQIARHLSISERTVKAHLTSIFQRIGVTDRTQAALWAERNGLRRDPR
jgi:DNA-binding NarL/FixJ family response regulator